MLEALRSEQIGTWFDLGIFIDRFRDRQGVQPVTFEGPYSEFRQAIQRNGLAFLAFQIGTEDVPAVARWVELVHQALGEIPVHLITGRITPRARDRFGPEQTHILPEMQGYHDWHLYDSFFHQRLERGGERYNRLIHLYWDDVLALGDQLGTVIHESGAQLLVLYDICSAPGNLSLNLATVLVAAHLGIPVISHLSHTYRSAEAEQFDLNSHLGEFYSLIELLLPWQSRSWLNLTSERRDQDHLIQIRGHNPANVGQIPADAAALEKLLYRLHFQLRPSSPAAIQPFIERYRVLCNLDAGELLPCQDRHYLPGYGRSSFMLYLKSLIDPSYFRIEEQGMRGTLMSFARDLAGDGLDTDRETREALHQFYNLVESIFLFHEGELSMRHDHSFAYRHRNRLHYLYRDFTHQELTGLVNLLFHCLLASDQSLSIVETGQHWPASPAIDDRDWLAERLATNVPMAYFPGGWNASSVAKLIIEPMRIRLGVEAGLRLEESDALERVAEQAPITIFCPQVSCGRRPSARALQLHLARSPEGELGWLFRRGLCRIVPTRQWSVGIHLLQLGQQACRQLAAIQAAGGYLVSDDPEAAMTTDMAAIDRFHVGRVHHPLAAGLMGLPVGSSYVQLVPANVRVTLAFPTPTQTGSTFSQALRALCQQYGREKVMHKVRCEARQREDPIAAARADLEPAQGERQVKSAVRITSLRGVYQDGQPWNGVGASLNPAGQWRFATLSSGGRTKPVTTFAREFQQANDSAPIVAWNGGYILNAELVGKLGLAESYIGSPLGLLISDGELLCPPLFNKPAFLVYPDGRLDIQRVNCSQGISISVGDSRLVLPASVRNPLHPPADQACFYDLLFGGDAIPGAGRVIVRLAGNTIIETLDTGSTGEVPVLPVGLTLSFPVDDMPAAWHRSGTRLRIEMLGWEPLEHAVEAGPMLVSRGHVSLDMETEGWKTANSIRTQAARLDFTDLRGPKIAIGLGKMNDLHLVAINGRIRESVGASHPELGQVLVGMGVQKAMGFDPGGSSTLVVHGRPINISPYNSDYQNNVVALPPQPRPVASAVIGYQI